MCSVFVIVTDVFYRASTSAKSFELGEIQARGKNNLSTISLK